MRESSRGSVFVLTVIVALGAVLRLWSIAAGAPWRIGVDEPFVLNHAIQILKSGDFNPHFFDYGGVTIYLHALVGAVRFIVGAAGGSWGSLDQFWMGDLLVYSRVVTALIGTLTIVVVYRIAARWSQPVAVVAALAMAVQPYHVRESHFALTDVPLTFCVALAWLLAVRASERRTRRAFVAAGLACGVAAAVKYPGAIALLLPLAATLGVESWRERLRMAGLTVAGAAVGFLAGAPYSVLDPPGFLNGFATLYQAYSQPKTVVEAGFIYVKYLRNALTWPGLIGLEVGWIGLLIVGAGLVSVVRQALLEPAKRPLSVVALAFPLYFFYFISDLGSLQFARYLLPLTPALSVFFALGVLALAHGVGAARPALGRAVGVGSLAMLLLPLGTAVSLNRSMSLVTTTDQVSAWIVTNVKRGEPVLSESRLTLLPDLTIEPDLRLAEKPVENYQAAGAVYFVVQIPRADYAREEDQARYDALMAATESVVAFEPSAEHPGPAIEVRRFPR